MNLRILTQTRAPAYRSGRSALVSMAFAQTLTRASTLVSAAIVLVASCGTLMAQSAGTLYLKVDPANFTYRLDHRYTMQKMELELLEGPHHFSFWAPQRRIVDTTLTVVGGQPKEFQLRLPFSAEYLAFQRDLQQFRQDRNLLRVPAVAITGGMVAFTVASWGKLKKAHDVLEADRAEYDRLGSPYRITVLKEQTIPEHKDAFRKAKTQFIVATSATVLCAGATAWLFHRTNNSHRPTYIDKEKLRFEGLSWMPGPNGGTWQGGLTWNISRPARWASHSAINH